MRTLNKKLMTLACATCLTVGMGAVACADTVDLGYGMYGSTSPTVKAVEVVHISTDARLRNQEQDKFLKVANKSVVTTGIYQRYFEADGKIYHHILDPRTGYPCENTLYSDTIITDSSLTADALSTVCYLMGYEAANDLIDQLENVDALFITNDNEIHYTKNFLR